MQVNKATVRGWIDRGLVSHEAATAVLDAAAADKQSKYRNNPVVVDGYRFDSEAEARYWLLLKARYEAGEISDLKVHPVYELQAGFRAYIEGKWRTVEPITYEADFAFCEGDQTVVEDVKGVQTPVFRLKAKLFRERYPEIELRIIAAKEV